MNRDFNVFLEGIRNLDTGITYTYTSEKFYIYSYPLNPLTNRKKLNNVINSVFKDYNIIIYSDFNYDVSYQIKIQFDDNVSCYLYISLIAPYATIDGDVELPIQYQYVIENLIKKLNIKLLSYNILTKIPMYPPVYLEQAEEYTNLFHCFFTS